MGLLIVAFIAGVLTVLAPCILPMLPIVVGRAVTGRRASPYIIVVSLGLSVIIFTLLLKATTALIFIPPQFWTTFSGTILVFFGLTLLFPVIWERLPGLSKLSISSNKTLGSGVQRGGFWGDVIVGASLGPIFSTCSPTYFVILAEVLPVSLGLGLVYLFSYTLGIGSVLLLISYFGERIVARLSFAANPNGYFKRTLGLLFILIGILIATGGDKQFQTYLLDRGFFDVTQIEQGVLKLIGR